MLYGFVAEPPKKTLLPRQQLSANYRPTWLPKQKTKTRRREQGKKSLQQTSAQSGWQFAGKRRANQNLLWKPRRCNPSPDDVIHPAVSAGVKNEQMERADRKRWMNAGDSFNPPDLRSRQRFMLLKMQMHIWAKVSNLETKQMLIEHGLWWTHANLDPNCKAGLFIQNKNQIFGL